LRPAGLLSAFIVVAWIGGNALADRLVLSGGGIVEVDQWWTEDDILYYRNADGTVGLPRSIVVRIEESEAPGDAVEAASAESPAEEKSAPAPTARLVPREIAERLTAAARALKARDFTTAAELYRGLMDDTEPDLVEPRVGYALTQMALGEDAMAHAVVLAGLARQPDEPALLELRGDLYNREERVDDAVRTWKEAFERLPTDRLREKILKGERELNAGRDYALDLTSHFNLRYDGEVEIDLVEAVTAFLEEQFWTMAEIFDHTPRQPITVILYPSRQFRDVTQSPEWVGGLYDGKIRVPLGGLRRLDPVARALLRHELTHAFVHTKTRGRCPRWLHEGLAQVMEQRTLTPRDEQAVIGRLGQVAPAEWETGGFSYPLALSLTSYLQDLQGTDGLVRVLDELSEGRSLEQALQNVYHLDYGRLCRDWATEVLDGEPR